ncbi:MAG: bifunctional phosphoribosylaminoimidazolecarboxamide formyltransferase/IMP cyclohydrolase, partial [Thermoplasmata archaeon]
DPVARYGCVVATNRPVEGDVPGALHGVFVDLLAAPEIVPDARAHLDQRPKIKLVRAQVPLPRTPRWELQGATGRLLVQDSDQRQLAPEDFRCVTTRPASPQEAGAMDFAWRVVRHAKSNAIVLTQGSCTVGIGSGVTSRVQAVKLALGVAGGRATGSVLASDGFFPFPDGVEAAGRAGVSVIIQPGGSIRDAEVIAMAEKYGISMYLTGWRVFRH